MPFSEENFSNYLDEERKEQEEQLKQAYKHIQIYMTDNNMSEIVAFYSGSGDSGCIEYFSDGKGNDISDELPQDFYGTLEDACLTMLSYNYPGWEIDEGSKGKITFQNKDNILKASIDHEFLQYGEEDTIEGFPDSACEDVKQDPDENEAGPRL